MILTTCIIILTVTFIFLSLQLIETLKQIRNTARAVEKLAENANERISEIEPAFKAVNSVTNAVTSGWVKLLTAIVGLFRKEG